MAFSQATISDVQIARAGAELLVSWTSSTPDPVTFQVYLDHVLAWSGPSRSVTLPMPPGRVAVSVATVAADEAETDFSGSLPALVLPFQTLTWEGGTFLSPDLAGFHIYGEPTAGGGIDFTDVLATVAAYPGGVVTDGYGMGGYGHGGYGRSASVYSWQTPALGNGVWTFAVAPFDAAGNEDATPATVAVTITAAPRPPAAAANGARLSYVWNPTTHVATLTWLASPA